MIIVVFEAFSDNNQRQSPSQLKLYVLRRTFKALFPHSWDFIEKETPDADWKTVKKYKLTERKLWYKYSDSSTIVGVRFGTNTLYGLYDIDWGSKYDPREQERSLNALRWELEEWGIVRIFFIQSSWSQGLHLYFFLSREVSTFRLACIMNKAAKDAGLEVKRGQLETFPNTKSYGCIYNGHRLPLQQGSFLLNKDYVPYSERVEDFISAAEWSAEGNDIDLLESRLEEAYDWFKVKKNQEGDYEPTPEDLEFIEQVDYCQREINEGFLGTIRLQVEAGFDGYGQTNDLLLTIAKLGRIVYGLSGQQYIDYIKETVMSCPGYRKYCRHQHEIDARCRSVAHFGEKQWYPYRTQMADKNRNTYEYVKNQLTNKPNLNREKHYNARSRIIQAVQYINENQGGLPQKVGECKLAIRNVTKQLFRVSVSDATLKKTENLSLWHPKHRGESSSKQDEVQNPTTPIENVQSSKSVVEFVEQQQHEELQQLPKTDLNEKPQEEEIAAKTPSTIELKIQLEILTKLDITQKSPKTVLQQTLPPKESPAEPQQKQSTPLQVVRKIESPAERLKAVPSLTLQKTVHTLPYMKGVLLPFVLELIYQVFQRAYFNLLMMTPRLELKYLGYQGRGTGGFVERKGKKQFLVQSIKPNTEVEILRKDYHSCCYRDNQSQLLVYIKPLENAEDWLNGIAVLIEHLIPIRVRDKISKSNKIKENSREEKITNDKSSLYPENPRGDQNSS